MDLISEDQGWILTEEKLEWTKTGGTSWVDMNLPDVPASSIGAATFLDSSRGWVVVREIRVEESDRFTVFGTADGGETWTAQVVSGTSPVHGVPDSIHFVDALNAFLSVSLESSSAVQAGVLFRSVDGGKEWRQLELPFAGTFSFVSPSVGWLTGGPSKDRVFRTTNGGTTWQESKLPYSFPLKLPTLSDPVFTHTGLGFIAAGYDNDPTLIEFFKTTDGGRTWTLASSLSDLPYGFFWRHIDILDDLNTLIVIGPAGSGALVSSDSGVSWIKTTSAGFSSAIHKVDFVSQSSGWALADGPGVCRSFKTDCYSPARAFGTSDGARTWNEITP